MRFPQDVPALTDGIVTLRAHTVDDAPAVVEQCQDPETVRWTRVPLPYTLDDAKRFVREAMPGGWADEIEHGFAIEAEGRFAGTCTLRSHGDRRAEIAYGLHPWARGRGLLDRALRLLVDWGFESGRFETVIWWAGAGNWASRKAAWKLGFSCHGPLAAWVPQREGLHDAWVGTLRATDPRLPQHPWYDAPRIESARVVLRRVAHTDGERLVESFNDPASQEWMRVPSPYTQAMAHDYVEQRTALLAEGKVVYWAAADPATDDLLGAVMLFDIEPGRSAELGYFAHPEARGRGLMTESAKLAVRHAFVPEEDGGLGLERVTAYAGVDNTASLGVIEAVGFRRYGVERLGGSNGRGDQYDLACHDLLREEFSL